MRPSTLGSNKGINDSLALNPALDIKDTMSLEQENFLLVIVGKWMNFILMENLI